MIGQFNEIDQPSISQYMDKINGYFMEIKERGSNPNLEAKMEYNLERYFELKDNFEDEIHVSTGFSEGSNKIHQTRVSEARDAREARDAVKVNDLIREYKPDLTVFHASVDKYILSEDFEGKRLHHADYDTLEKHVENIIEIEMGTELISPIRVIGLEKYTRENYENKLGQNLETIQVECPNISESVLNEVLELAPRYNEVSIEPAWDMGWLKNAKFNKNGEVKCFDWTKAARILRTPIYEPVQAAYSYGKNIDKIKEYSKAKYGNYHINQKTFDTLWDMGVLYFLTRRMHYAPTDDEFKNYQNQLLEEEFPTLEPARKLRDEIASFQ